MDPYELLIQNHAVPLLQEGEKIEASARVHIGGISQRFFVAAATSSRVILVEMKSGAFRPKPEFAGTTQVHYGDIERLATGSFLTLKHIVVVPRSGRPFTLSMNNLAARIPGQERFVGTVKALYTRYQTRVSHADVSARLARNPDAPGLSNTQSQSQRRSSRRRGFLAGLVGTTVAAALWATIAVLGEAPIVWMALGVGILVGVSVRIGGRGADRKFGLVAATLAVLGCALGTLIWAAYFFAMGGDPLQRLLRLITVPSVTWEVVSLAYDPRRVILYSVAALTAFGVAFRQADSPEEQVPRNDGPAR